MQYRKKPVVIKAVQYDGYFRCLDEFAISEVSHFIVSKDEEGKQCIKIPTLEGEMTALIGDYIIRGVKGEYYPCKPDIFEMTYESVDTSTQQENLYTEEDMMEYAVWLCIETNSASGRDRTSKDLLSEWVKKNKKD